MLAQCARREGYRLAGRLGLTVLIASNGSRPLRSCDLPHIRMVFVGLAADAVDNWIAAQIRRSDICVTSNIPLGKL